MILPPETLTRTTLSAVGTTVPLESTIENRISATSPGAAVTVSRSVHSRSATAGPAVRTSVVWQLDPSRRFPTARRTPG